MKYFSGTRHVTRPNNLLISETRPHDGSRFLCSVAEILQREFGSPGEKSPTLLEYRRKELLSRLSQRRRAFLEESMTAVKEIVRGDEGEDESALKKTSSETQTTREDGMERQTGRTKRAVEVRTTSTEVIRLLVDRLKTRSWLELDKDMRMRRIEPMPSEVAWVLRVQKNCTRAWEFFKWAASRPGYKHDSTCYGIMIELLGRFAEYSLLEELLAEMERLKVPCTVSTVNTLIGIYSAAENIDRAEQHYLKLEQLNLRPSAYTCKCMLQAFAKAGRFSKASEIYRTVQRERLPLDNISYNMLLNALFKNGEEESAWNVFKDMKQIGNVADVYTYTILARSLGQAGMVNRALELLDEMAAEGVKPNTYMFNTILGKQDKADEGIKLFKKMLNVGVEPDFSSYRAIVKLLCKGRQLGGAFELLKLIKEKPVRKVAYQSFIKVLGNMGYIREVRTLFQGMEHENLKPSVGVYLSMIDAFCRAAEPDEALVVMKEMNQNGCRPPTTTCNSIISALGKSNKLQVAYELFKEMKEKGPPPDTVTYNCLITGLAKAGKVGLAEDLFDEMERSGCLPNVVSYNSLMHSFGRMGDVDSACRLLQLMQDKGITPDVITYNSVIQCFGRAGKADTALAIFKEMREKGCSPSFLTYNNVLQSLAKAGMVDSVLSLYKQMKEQGFVPDARTFRTLSLVYESSPHLDKRQLKAEIHIAGLAHEVTV